MRRARGVRRARRLKRAGQEERGTIEGTQRTTKAAGQAKLAAFLLNKYGAGASRLAAAEAVAEFRVY